MFLLIYITVNIKIVLLYVARMQAWRRLRHWSMPSPDWFMPSSVSDYYTFLVASDLFVLLLYYFYFVCIFVFCV